MRVSWIVVNSPREASVEEHITVMYVHDRDNHGRGGLAFTDRLLTGCGQQIVIGRRRLTFYFSSVGIEVQ